MFSVFVVVDVLPEKQWVVAGRMFLSGPRATSSPSSSMSGPHEVNCNLIVMMYLLICATESQSDTEQTVPEAQDPSTSAETSPSPFTEKPTPPEQEEAGPTASSPTHKTSHGNHIVDHLISLVDQERTRRLTDNLTCTFVICCHMTRDKILDRINVNCNGTLFRACHLIDVIRKSNVCDWSADIDGLFVRWWQYGAARDRNYRANGAAGGAREQRRTEKTGSAEQQLQGEAAHLEMASFQISLATLGFHSLHQSSHTELFNF